MPITDREVRKEAREHERLARELGLDPMFLGRKIAEDHARRGKTTTKDGKRKYMKEYMRDYRTQLNIPDLSAAIGFKRRR